MRFGVTLSSDQPSTTVEARRAEDLGFDLVATGEHLFFHVPVTNAFVSLAAAAGATSRVRVLSSLTLLPLYPPALAVKMATTLDQVSRGRFDLGVGVGGEFPAEFVAAGVDVRQRGARTDETLALMEALWSGDRVTHEGRFARIPDLALAPGPLQPGGPPRWLGGRSSAAMNRAGRFADVWMPYMYTPDQLAASLVEVRSAAERCGRDPRSVRGAVFVWGALDEDGSRSRAWAIDAVSATYQQDFTHLADRYLLSGSVDDVARRVVEYRDAGAETFVFAPVGDGSRRASMVDLFAGSVIPQVSSAAARREPL
jgi:probable F420-dependent oxidoreductase